MKKKTAALFLTFCMALNLLSVPASAASKKNFNDTEFHISGISEMKDFVSEKLDVPVDDITIHGVEINGLRNGKSASATGGTINHGYLNVGDVGTPGTNGQLVGWDNYWMVLNTFKIIDEDSVSSITIYSKEDTWHGLFGKKLEPVTVYLDEEDVSQIPGKLITEISLENASLVPYTEYTLTYDANGGVDAPAAETVKEGTYHTLSAQQPTHAAVDGTDVLFAGWSLDYAMIGKILDADDTPTGMITTNHITMNQDFTVYAVWAEDANKNGMPDYQEEPIMVTFRNEKFDSVSVLNPLSNDFGQAPKVVAPAGQRFVNWVMEGDAAKTLSDGAYFNYNSMFQMANGKTNLVFTPVFEEIPDVRYIFNVVCDGEVVDFNTNLCPEGTVFETKEQLDAFVIIQDPFYYNGSTYRYTDFRQDGTTINLYYEKEVTDVRYIVNLYCDGAWTSFVYVYYPEGTLFTADMLKSEGILQDPFYNHDDKTAYDFVKMEQDGHTVNLYYTDKVF